VFPPGDPGMRAITVMAVSCCPDQDRHDISSHTL